MPQILGARHLSSIREADVPLLHQPQLAAYFRELGLVEDGVGISIRLYAVNILKISPERHTLGLGAQPSKCLIRLPDILARQSSSPLY